MARNARNTSTNTDATTDAAQTEGESEVTETTETTEATETATKVAPDISAFQAVAAAAMESGDFSGVTAAYVDLDRAAKGAATRYVNAEMKAALVERKDPSEAILWSQVSSGLETPKAAKEKKPREPKAPANTTEGTVEKLAALWLGYVTLQANLPEGTDAEGIDDKVNALVSASQADVDQLLAYRADESEEKGDAPEVSDIATKAVKLAFSGAGRKSGSSGTGSTYDGPRRSIGKHIAEAFADQPSGTFLPVSAIHNFVSTEYGDDKPSAGAISSALKSGKSLPEGITAGVGGEKNQAGAIKA